MFFNGSIVGTATNNTAVLGSSTSGTAVGYNGSSHYFNGYVSDVRIVKGTAVYTSAFTPPTQPLTAIANTSLLTLQYNGGATNQGIIDNSNFNNIVTRFGNTSQGTFSPYSVTGWSNYFDGTGDYLSIPTNTALDLGTGDYTIEGWWYFSDTSNQSLVSKYGPGGYGFVVQYQSGNLRMVLGSSGTDNVYSFSWTPSINTWYHVTITRSGTNGRAFINGTQIGSTQTFTTTTNTASTNALQIGLTHTVSEYTRGYVSNFRLVKGTAVYTSAFTPSTTPLTAIANTSLLTCQSNRFIDNSPNSFTLTRVGDVSVQALDPFGSVPEAVPISYSNYFDGTGDYLTVSGTAISFGTAAYTIEFWIYRTAAPGLTRLFERGTGGTDFSMDLSSVGVLTINNNTTISGSTCTTSIPLNTWTHIALVRTSTSASGTAWYINGVASGTFTHSTNIASGGTLYITTGGLTGHLSNLRFLNGTALYTTAFTPSTTPLTAIANTSLLTCQSTGMIDNSTNNFAITGVGDTKPVIFNPFGYTAQSATSYTPSLHGGSAYFDGTGDRLTVPDNTALESFKDFTIEFWVYYNSVAGSQVIVDKGWNDATFAPYMIYTTGGNILVYSSSTGGSWDVLSGNSWGAVVPGTWYHIALSRSGSSIRLFKNGALMTTVTNSSILHNSASVLGIGASPAAGGMPLNGYISDLRMVHTAVYTAAFIPPTSSLTPITNTSLLLNFNNGGIIDQHGTNVLETVGNTQLAPQDPYGGSYYSNYFDGTGDYLTVPDNAVFEMTDDFTVEAWFYCTALPGSGAFGDIITKGAAGVYQPYYIFIRDSGALVFYSSSNGSSWDVASNVSFGTIAINTWYHVAVSRSGSSLRMFLNGALINTIPNSNALTNNVRAVAIGARSDGTEVFTGYISNVRIVKGTAVYTSTFTPSTTPLTAIANTSLLTCQSNSFKDNSTNAFTITRNGDTKVQSVNPFQQNTGKSLYFDGTGDYLTTLAKDSLSFGTGDFTVEAWVYFASIAADRGILGSSAGGGYDFVWRTSNGLNIGRVNTAFDNSFAFTPVANTWYHIAYSRSGTSLRAFVNGTQVGTTATNSTAYNSVTAVIVGGSTTADRLMNGYIDDLRITKGYARYTSNFTAPTSALITK